MFPCISPEPLIIKPTWATVHRSADDRTAHVTHELPFPYFNGALQEYLFLVSWICISTREANIAALGNSHKLGTLRYSQILSYTFSIGTVESDCTFADLRMKHLHCKQTTCWNHCCFTAGKSYIPRSVMLTVCMKMKAVFYICWTIFKLITMKLSLIFKLSLWGWYWKAYFFIAFKVNVSGTLA